MGALSSGYFIYELSDKLNSDVFKNFLIRLIDQFKKVVIVIDHGPYHVSKNMQQFYAENKEHLHVEYFPSYSPELDPIEQSWRETKRWLAIRNWNNKGDLKEQLISAFQEDLLKYQLRLFKNLTITPMAKQAILIQKSAILAISKLLTGQISPLIEG